MPNPPKALIFDLGNVIVFFDHTIIIRKLMEHHPYSPEEIRDAFFKSRLVERYSCGQITSAQFYSELKKSLDFKYDFETFGFIFSDIFTENRPIIDLIQKLSKHFPLYLLSDTNELHFEFIKKHFPVVYLFKAHALSYEIGHVKPNAAVYQHVLKQSGLKPHELVFIDDLEANAKGAEAVGIAGIWFQGHEHLIKRLKELGVHIPA